MDHPHTLPDRAEASAIGTPPSAGRLLALHPLDVLDVVTLDLIFKDGFDGPPR